MIQASVSTFSHQVVKAVNNQNTAMETVAEGKIKKTLSLLFISGGLRFLWKKVEIIWEVEGLRDFFRIENLEDTIFFPSYFKWSPQIVQLQTCPGGFRQLPFSSNGEAVRRRFLNLGVGRPCRSNMTKQSDTLLPYRCPADQRAAIRPSYQRQSGPLKLQQVNRKCKKTNKKNPSVL